MRFTRFCVTFFGGVETTITTKVLTFLKKSDCKHFLRSV
nr:MAG TPA: hypothetical protein [Caudoviricetes sp.]